MMNVQRRPDLVRVGISACLLGEPVRYDGGHKRDGYIVETLGPYFQWVPVCPEVELGLGTPREPIRLEEDGGTVRLVSTESRQDITKQMRRYARRRVEDVIREEISGYLLKSRSPSCGLQRVKVYHGRGAPRKRGIGLFAAELLRRSPNLPLEEEDRLHDPALRENWIERVFAYHDLQRLFRPRWTLADLSQFHRRYKFALMAHWQKGHRDLSGLVAEAESLGREELRQRYEERFMAVLRRPATPRKHTSVLRHVLRVFERELDRPARQKLLEQIDDYRHGRVPLVVPLVLVRHYAQLLDVESLREQVYLNPHPSELALRNHV